MDAVPFVFVTWGFWAIRHLRDSFVPCLIATLCVLLAIIGASSMLWHSERGGFALLAAAWIIYAITGAYFWTRIMAVSSGDSDLYYLPRVKRP
jgi:hypothetical protein